MLNCLVVGQGWWGQKIVESLADSDVVKVVAAVDPLPGPREWAASHCDSVFASLDEAIQRGGFDGVIITSPHKEHAAHLAQSIDAGLHVFCEKPFTTDAHSAKNLLDQAESANLVVGIGHERRFEPAVRELQRLAGSGELGTLLVLEGTFSHDKFLSLPPDNWRLSPEVAPVGPLSATGIHLMDLSISLLGWPTEVWANLNSAVPPLNNGAALSVGIKFQDGGSALISAILSTPFAMRLCLYGTHGWVEIRDRAHPEAPTGWDVTSRCSGDDEPRTDFFPPFGAVRENIETWGRAILRTGSYPITHTEILANVQTFEAITKAAITGETVRLRR